MLRPIFRRREELTVVRTTYEVDCILGVSVQMLRKALDNLPDDALLVYLDYHEAADDRKESVTLGFRSEVEETGVESRQ